MQELWNTKFNRDGFLYGQNPNNFIKENIGLIQKNSDILCLGEGEGRNAMFLAKQGLHVEALDASDIGLKKLKQWSVEEKTPILITHTLISDWDAKKKYDAIVSTFMHLPLKEQEGMFLKAVNALKDNGYFIAEFFSSAQLNFKSGGPKDTNLLYKLDHLYQIFSKLPCEICKLSQEITCLNEGEGHIGEGSVIRIILKKNSIVL